MSLIIFIVSKDLNTQYERAKPIRQCASPLYKKKKNYIQYEGPYVYFVYLFVD